MPLNVLLVEDDRALAESLAEEMAALDVRMSIADEGRAALVALGESQFDAVVLDRMMPRLDGMSVLRRMREDGMTVPVIMLTALTRSVEKIEGLDAGADDYVAKPVAAEELAARLHAVLRGRGWSKPGTDTLEFGDIVVSPTHFRAWRAGRPIDLGKIEVSLLAEFLRNPANVLTRRMLYDRVWGFDFDPRSNILDVYIRRLRQKLTETGGTDPISTVRGIGYSLGR